jgi:hypothetical protein
MSVCFDRGGLGEREESRLLENESSVSSFVSFLRSVVTNGNPELAYEGDPKLKIHIGSLRN